MNSGNQDILVWWRQNTPESAPHIAALQSIAVTGIASTYSHYRAIRMRLSDCRLHPSGRRVLKVCTGLTRTIRRVTLKPSCVNYITLEHKDPSYILHFWVLGVDMSIISTYGSFNYADLPLATYRADEVVLVAGSRTGQLQFLKKGAVAVVMRGAQIAIVDEPGAVFGEISALLDLPHSAEVRTLGPSQFHVADSALLGHNAAALFYVAAALARRLDSTMRP